MGDSQSTSKSHLSKAKAEVGPTLLIDFDCEEGRACTELGAVACAWAGWDVGVVWKWDRHAPPMYRTIFSASFLPLVTPLSVHSVAFIFAVSPYSLAFLYPPPTLFYQPRIYPGLLNLLCIPTVAKLAAAAVAAAAGVPDQASESDASRRRRLCCSARGGARVDLGSA
ncbi:hypothetical protein B0H14DRAFT_3499671 [Mycena olivaceomarginata]|nr:hypothetical protein B0H14DRAFT_3499671 [Mycena olivaceomarginata]